jgi:hypothetical protein
MEVMGFVKDLLIYAQYISSWIVLIVFYIIYLVFYKYVYITIFVLLIYLIKDKRWKKIFED